MKHLLSTLFCALLLMISPTTLFAQDMAFDMRSSGKIYVVVAVLLIIFLGIFAFLIYLDKKIKKLESKE